MSAFGPNNHTHYLRLALLEAKKSPPRPTNFCVGALLLAPPDLAPTVTGYTLECEGNTHAEQSCFIKLAEKYQCPMAELGEHLPDGVVLYTTMEPCNMRSVGNTSCVDRILALKKKDGSQAIAIVVCGVQEPETFVGVNEGQKKLQDAGVEVLHVTGLEEDILAVATAGHEKKASS
ncbi:Putative cytidine and deoxycytidylate deaminase domain, cytidine deaminase [Septoria linicola]|uniref:Cytidine and deoxycytidylate deaminase domain, cytidine deaminase n=1 Tax=Septoria linicola TaxID=215465 RepID=A0A9Q9ATW5_9PEZI|nr:putative cytidine and deoxycytidylate deaminase domain, cytidine deaminase [Septoria linicola]USW52450.1 Putative cytidine and deoxycytidylate deaminase domain, cytidine deaminase [Septoria linicola]